MQIEPSAEKFAARYEAGEPQVVWTTLVADLETPVSAFLKIAGSRPMSFLLESVEGGAVRGRYSIIGLEPDYDLPRRWRRRRAQPRAGEQSGSVRADERAAAAGAAHLHCRKPHCAARRAAAHGRRRVRLSRLRHGAADRGIAGAGAGPDRHPGRHAGAPDDRDRVRCGQRHHHRGLAGAAACRRCRRRPRWRARSSASPRWSMRSTGRSTKRRRTSIWVRSKSRRARTPRRPNSKPWCCAPRSTSPPAIFFRWCCRSASRRRSSCRRSRFTGRCAASILRPICSSSNSAASPSPDRARS